MINKRSFLFILSLILVADYLLIATPLNAQVVGRITKVEGRVDILRVGAVRAEPVRVGDTVSIGDILRTKSDGKVEIGFVDDSLMKLGPRSRLGIEEYLYKPEEDKRQASLKLYRGRTGFVIPKPIYSGSGSKFEMKTRTAVAGVRGTEGILITDGVEMVYVKEGVIEFSNPLGMVEVSQGEVGVVRLNMPPQERPFTEREYQQQERQVTPKPPEKAEEKPPVVAKAPLPKEAPPPAGDKEGKEVAKTSPPPPKVEETLPPPTEGEAALPPPTEIEETLTALTAPTEGKETLPPPTEGESALLPPPLPITEITPPKRVFNVTTGINYGEVGWHSLYDYVEGEAALISGSISGSFNQTIPEGGYYHLDMGGSYAWDPSKSDIPTSNATDDFFGFVYSGNTSEGNPFYGASWGDINTSSKVWGRTGPDSDYDGVTIGWIEEGSKRFWYGGWFSGSYNNIIYNNSTTRLNDSGTFSGSSDGLFWDGSMPIWEAVHKMIPTLPGGPPEFFVPITETALRQFDISGSGSLSITDVGDTLVGSMSTSISGKGAEFSPGSGLFDVDVRGNWSATTTIDKLREIHGTINGSTSIDTIGTTFSMSVDGGIRPIGHDTALVAAYVKKAGGEGPWGPMVGKMTGSTSGQFEGKAIGEIYPGFMLP